MARHSVGHTGAFADALLHDSLCCAVNGAYIPTTAQTHHAKIRPPDLRRRRTLPRDMPFPYKSSRCMKSYVSGRGSFAMFLFSWDWESSSTLRALAPDMRHMWWAEVYCGHVTRQRDVRSDAVCSPSRRCRSPGPFGLDPTRCLQTQTPRGFMEFNILVGCHECIAKAHPPRPGGWAAGDGQHITAQHYISADIVTCHRG